MTHSVAMAFFLFATASTLAHASESQRYVHHGKEIAVTIVVWGYDPQRPGMQQKLSFPIKIAPGEAFSKPSELIPLKAYTRAGIELRAKKMILPELEDMRKTSVSREGPQYGGTATIARSDRVNAWPKDFQLRDGDVISITPLNQ